MHPNVSTHHLNEFFSRVHGIIVLNMAIYARARFFLQRWSRAKIWKIFKVGKHIDGGVIDMCLQGRIFKAFSEKPKNAIKIKIGCVVTEWESFELNPDHLWRITLYRVYNLNERLDQGARTSYFHHSLGGYHGAKLGKYQEVMDMHISKGNMDKDKALILITFRSIRIPVKNNAKHKINA